MAKYCEHCSTYDSENKYINSQTTYRKLIAKLAYKDISRVISKWEQNKDIAILCFWPGIISIQGQTFQNHELE